jgi:hypothetical protein
MRWRHFLGAIALSFFGFPIAVQAACSSYPYTLTNGTTADATQVMANFTTVSGCAGSAAPLASPSFTGTVNVSGNIVVTAPSGHGLDVNTPGNAFVMITSTASAGAALGLNRH